MRTLSSSNVINREPASTTPSPSPTFPTALTLSVNLAQKDLLGTLLDLDSGQPVSQPVPLTITFTGTGVPPNLVATQPEDQGFYTVPFEPPTTPGTYTVQAHFAGAPAAGFPGGTLVPSDSKVVSFTIT